MKSTTSPKLSHPKLAVSYLILYLCQLVFYLWQYGFSHGGYFWMHHLGYLGVGIGLWKNRKDLIVVSLALSFPQELFWLLDHVLRTLMGLNVFHLMEALYQPGLSLTEFALIHFHYLYLPLGLIALKQIYAPNEHKRKSRSKPNLDLTYLVLIVLQAIIYTASYFLFSAESDPNCARTACLSVLEHLPAKVYPFAYGIGYGLAAICIAYLIRKTEGLKGLSSNRYFWGIYLFLGIISLLRSFSIFYGTPRFSCEDTKVPGEVSMKCLNTTEYGPGYLRLSFAVINENPKARLCALYISHKERKERMYESVLTRGKSRIELNVTVPYPQDPQGMRAKISAECKKVP